MATSLSNNAVQWSLGIAMATKSPGVHLRSIPGFQRRLENATDFAATRLHAILYNGKEAQKDLREEILNWRGVSGDALPSLYLRLVRWFEATGSTRWSKTQLVRFFSFLNISTLSLKSINSSKYLKILSLFLTLISFAVHIRCFCFSVALQQQLTHTHTHTTRTGTTHGHAGSEKSYQEKILESSRVSDL